MSQLHVYTAGEKRKHKVGVRYAARPQLQLPSNPFKSFPTLLANSGFRVSGCKCIHAVLLELGDGDRGRAEKLRQILGGEDDGAEGSGDKASALA
jgi:hypothetical protein